MIIENLKSWRDSFMTFNKKLVVTNENFCSKNVLDNYEKLPNGLIRQKRIISKIKYNRDYIRERYDSYKSASVNMGFLRLGYLLGTLKSTPSSILDVGYGNGDFLSAANKHIGNSGKCYGFEVNGYDIPDGCIKVDDIFSNSYDVVCFFDVLEHFDNVYDIQNLKTNYIYISVPNCTYLSDEWFLNWKHRRPDEHLWHFNENSLTNFMSEIGFIKVSCCFIEDTLRKSKDSENILTSIFKKK